MTPLLVRRATAADALAMAPLLGVLGYETPAAALPERLARVEAEGGAAFLATDDAGQILGLTVLARHAALHATGPVAYITALVTAPDARGRGVGRALVDAAEGWARAGGCVRLSVTSAEHRADAHAFYPRCGMPCTGRRFSKPLSPGA
jgi:GNAT superfamily N-acetyltransferase